jgi:hypothetical protein
VNESHTHTHSECFDVLAADGGEMSARVRGSVDSNVGDGMEVVAAAAAAVAHTVGAVSSPACRDAEVAD